MNVTGKKSGGLVGITNVASSLSQWTPISSHTKQMFHVTMDGDDDVYTHTECTKGRRQKMMEMKQEWQHIWSVPQQSRHNDLGTVSIEESLLGSECLGKRKLNEFVEKSICLASNNDQHDDLKVPIGKNKAVTFASLYTVVRDVKGKQSTIKMNRNILQRLITA